MTTSTGPYGTHSSPQPGGATSEDHLLLALEAGGLGTWRWEMATGTTTWDARTEQLFGIEPGTFDGTFDAWVAMLHPDDVEQMLATVAEAVERRGHYEIDHRVVWPDGTVRWLQGRGAVLVDDDDEVVGTIGCVADITERVETERAMRELAELAERATHSERRERQRVAFLSEINAAALDAVDHLDFIGAVTSLALPLLGEWCIMHFAPDAATEPVTELAHTRRVDTEWAGSLRRRLGEQPAELTGLDSVIRTGRTRYRPSLEVEDAPLSSDPVAARLFESLPPTGEITVPMVSLRGVIGAIQFVSTAEGRSFGESDLALAEAAAGRVAAVLDNMWLSDQQRRIAATLQQSLLPVRLPEVPGLDTAVRYWAAGTATEVGGDFYDLFDLGKDRWALVIGDVCGTGPTAASLTSVARHTIRAAARHDTPVDQVLAWVSDAVAQSGTELFCTAWYAQIERSDTGWTMTCTSGGHPPPVLVSRAGPELIPARGPLLGVIEEISTPPEQVALHSGDVVVMYTDGVTDLPPPYGVGEEQLLTMVADAVWAAKPGPGRAERIAKELGRRIETWRSVVERGDDIALMVLCVE